jgi:hypothetical protein
MLLKDRSKLRRTNAPSEDVTDPNDLEFKKMMPLIGLEVTAIESKLKI